MLNNIKQLQTYSYIQYAKQIYSFNKNKKITNINIILTY